LEGLEGVRKVMTDERLHEVSVLFEDQEASESVMKDTLQKEGFFVEEAAK
jgi:hypothetical protein